jgi:8-oxo-dGTP pyrophosphatase MutT (NUDIX family)
MFIHHLQQQLQQPLPGFAAQSQMISRKFALPRDLSRLRPPADHRKAAVLILLYEKDAVWHTTLMQRPDSPYAHSRQVSFPGGRVEEDDPSLAYTALRETQEELGIPSQQIELIGQLSPLYIPVSNFLVAPFVGHLAQLPVFQPDPNEVAEVLETPLHWVLSPERQKTGTVLSYPGPITLEQVPYFDLHERQVWGATAMMLSELSVILRQSQLDHLLL